MTTRESLLDQAKAEIENFNTLNESAEFLQAILDHLKELNKPEFHLENMSKLLVPLKLLTIEMELSNMKSKDLIQQVEELDAIDAELPF